MSKVGKLHPAAVLSSSAGKVEVGVVSENSGLLNVFFVVGGLLGISFGTDLCVLLSGEARWNIRLISEGSGLNVLLSSGTVFVTVGDRGPKIQVRDGLEKSIELGGDWGLGGGHEGGGRGHGGSDDKGGGLHGAVLLQIK